MPNTPSLTLTPDPHSRLDEPNMHIMLFGEKVGIFYFNLRGYVGYLPTKDGIPLDPGEKSLSTIKKALAPLKKEWDCALKEASDPEAFKAAAQAKARQILVQ